MSCLLCLFEDDRVDNLRPLVETRSSVDLRLGIRSLLEATRDAFSDVPLSGLALLTRPSVAPVTAQTHPDAAVNTLPDDVGVLFVNARFVPQDGSAVEQIRGAAGSGEPPHVFTRDEQVVAAWIPASHRPLSAESEIAPPWSSSVFDGIPASTLPQAALVDRPWNLLSHLRPAIERDVDARTDAAPSRPITARPQARIHDSVIAVHPDQIYFGQDATVHPGAILNAEDGPIYIGAEATIYEHAVVRGPSYIGPKTEIKTGANVEGVSFGYWCKVGGEVHDTVLHSLSNKAHPGFLGHSYLGRWCNIGADTNTSNLKNDYREVAAYAPAEQAYVSTDRQFLGLFMGDHSKCGINTMFNTGTVVGTFCNLFGGDFMPRYVPPFSWGGPSTGFEEYRLEKALSVAERVMARRETSLTDADKVLLTSVFEGTAQERKKHLA